MGSELGRDLSWVPRESFGARSTVAVWLMLSAPTTQRDELYATVEVFCASRPNARAVEARGTRSGRAYVYLVVNCGDVAGALAGDERAVAGLATVRAAISRLFMFEPVVVPEPAGERTA